MPSAKILILAAALLVAGAGCQNQITNQNNDATPDDNEITRPINNPVVTLNELNSDKFQVTIEPKETGTLQVKWTVDDALANEAEGYRLILGKDPNPVYPGSYWYERGSAHREKLWTELPSGKRYFRACIVKNDECVLYSENQEVIIP